MTVSDVKTDHQLPQSRCTLPSYFQRWGLHLLDCVSCPCSPLSLHGSFLWSIKIQDPFNTLQKLQGAGGEKRRPHALLRITWWWSSLYDCIRISKSQWRAVSTLAHAPTSRGVHTSLARAPPSSPLGFPTSRHGAWFPLPSERRKAPPTAASTGNLPFPMRKVITASPLTQHSYTVKFASSQSRKFSRRWFICSNHMGTNSNSCLLFLFLGMWPLHNQSVYLLHWSPHINHPEMLHWKYTIGWCLITL